MDHITTEISKDKIIKRDYQNIIWRIIPLQASKQEKVMAKFNRCEKRKSFWCCLVILF